MTLDANTLDAPRPAQDEDAEAARRAEIRALIRRDPSLVLDDAGAMHALIAADDGAAARKVTDLRGAMVARLEQRLARLEETHASVVAAAYESISGADQIHRAVLAALEPVRFSDLLTALEHEIPVILGVDHVRLCLEGDGPPGVEGALTALKPGEVDRYLALGRPGTQPVSALRMADPEAAPLVFGAKAGPIGSEAAVRLDFGSGTRPGMLAFGAEDPERFGPEQGADLILFFGGVMQRAIRRWVVS